MKKAITTLLSGIIMISLYSQNKTSDLQPKGMVFVPQGSFEMKTTKNSETKASKVSVDAFWMSNEITNAEYREYVDWAKNNPDKKLYQEKYHVAVVSGPKKGSMRDTMIIDRVDIKVSTFNLDMIDPLSLEKVNKDYTDYFTNKKFNDYPVVGVSFKMAEYFCLWKTMLENEQMKEKGLSKVQSYRIPFETEWEYVAQQPIKKGVKNGLVQKVNDGNTNEWGLFHLDNNVSEWVTSKQIEAGIVRGGSWKSENSISERQLINPDSKEPYIGFRIVRSYITGNK
jgi:formylglycine-generating enzyme required for sulfatase activity